MIFISLKQTLHTTHLVRPQLHCPFRFSEQRCESILHPGSLPR